MIRILKQWLGETNFVRVWRTRKLLRWSTAEPAATVLSRPGRYANAATETIFQGKSGVSLTVIKGYRYATSPALSYLPPFRLLAGLDRESLLSTAEREKYHRALGTRALSIPYDEVLDLVAQLLVRVSHRLAPETQGVPERAELIPLNPDLAARMANEISVLRSRLIRVHEFAAPISPGCKVLEIGFATGGHSINAWEKLGFRATGIDDAYDGTAEPPALHMHIARRLGTHPTFVYGDITKQTQLDDESFDIIYSVSVLEHISDIAAAFFEMRRLLKPGGLMVHCWNPYFSPNGGHPWGLLDCPWGHLRLPMSDIDQYLDEMRPLEAHLAKPWVWNTLDRATTLGRMQTKVAEAGFRLLLWDQVPDSPDILGDITPSLFAACQAQYPAVTLADLTTRDAMMVAQKTDTPVNS
jgi:ubiquinone/menaquinone biosynthesis C-methylase UbiE